MFDRKNHFRFQKYGFNNETACTLAKRGTIFESNLHFSFLMDLIVLDLLTQHFDSKYYYTKGSSSAKAVYIDRGRAYVVFMIPLIFIIAHDPIKISTKSHFNTKNILYHKIFSFNKTEKLHTKQCILLNYKLSQALMIPYNPSLNTRIISKCIMIYITKKIKEKNSKTALFLNYYLRFVCDLVTRWRNVHLPPLAFMLPCYT